jgi:pimeloyl-ACP methyl ester carboxylesterase
MNTKIKNIAKVGLTALIMSQALFVSTASADISAPTVEMAQTTYKTMKIEGLDIFYREAGSPSNPTLLLLHGFPTSSHMFRKLIPELSEQYHVIAPDYPGYGNSSMPSVEEFDYTFDHMASIVEQLLNKKKIEKYSMYVMDYGAPVGFRIASANPEKIESLIIQNGNAYNEGLENNFWEPIKAYWKDRKAVNKGLDNSWWKNIKAAYKQPNMVNEDALRFLLTKGATTWQYTNGVRDTSKVGFDAINEDQRLLDREGNEAIQLQMFYDYGTNPALYPEWQAYFRKYQPATLIVWGDKDEIFPSAGAHPYKKDLQNLEFHLLDTGHFVLEEDGKQVANYMKAFLNKNVKRN